MSLLLKGEEAEIVLRFITNGRGNPDHITESMWQMYKAWFWREGPSLAQLLEDKFVQNTILYFYPEHYANIIR